MAVLHRPSTGSALSAHSASRALLDQWLSLDGWLLLLGTIGAVGCLFVRSLRPLGAVVALLVAAGLRPGYLPEPYVIALLPFMALAAAGAADAGWSALRERPPVPIRPHAQREHQMILAGRAVTVGLAVAILAALVPHWLHGDSALADVNQTTPIVAAEHWLEANAQGTTHRADRGFGRDLLVDDTMWSDLVTNGFEPRQVIWFYKLDYVDNLDPSVRRRIQDYRDFGYVVSSPIIRSGLRQSPAPRYALARQALAHSTPVATFGTGPDRIVIDQVNAPRTTTTNQPTTTPRRQQ